MMKRQLPIAGQSATVPTPTSSSGRRFTVEGLCCATEARQIEAKLRPHPGVTSLRIDPVSHMLAVHGPIDTVDVERAIADLGMTARPLDAPRPHEGGWSRNARLVLAIIAGTLWIASLVAGRISDVLAAVLAVGAVAAGGRYVFPRAVRAARHFALDMNFLMSIAALGALLIGEYAEAASVMFLFAVAQLLETASMDRARNAIRSLMELKPAQATVLRNGRELRVPADAVRIGETVIVRPGEKLPVDGEVAAGRSSIDQAAITGESIPVSREPGDEVFAGTVNGVGLLEIRSTRAPGDTTLARIIHSVEVAQATRAPSQSFVDRFARVYTPAVVGAATLLAVAPALLFGASGSEWVYRALALLVVACPCALVISTPVTVVSALAGAARRGILIKGGLHLEVAGRARVVAFDKTGTITEGRPEVVEVVAQNGHDAHEVLRLAASVEARSEHPLAAAIVERARSENLVVPSATHARALPGRGAEAHVDGRRILVGSERLFAEEGAHDLSAAAVVREHESRGRTVILVGGEDGGDLRVIGAIALADRVRAEARDVLAALRRSGIREVALLTGDNAATAAAVAATLDGGLTVVRAALLPDDKVAALRELRATHGPVLMVGDGINDAPALAAADVGVAMGAAGTDVALETADVALMADDLSRLPTLLRLARKAERIIRHNIAFALLVKAVFVILAIAGVATLWMAVLADMGASLLVIANGMRALHVDEAGAAPASATPPAAAATAGAPS